MLLALTLVLQLASPDPRQEPLHQRDTREARNAQARFERTRRSHLPLKPSAGASGHCDIRVGRFCYWYDATDTAVEPDPPRVARARDELLAVLDDVAMVEPADAWVLGQRVRYLIEAGRWRRAAALSAMPACGAERWWCHALRATALHVGLRYAESDSTFSAALAAMPADLRCEWMDLRTIADRVLARGLDPLTCGDAEEVRDRLLRLGQPLWLTGGSDLRSEHLARRTMIRIFEESAMPNGVSFGDDSRELVLRYGWSEWFTTFQPDIAAYPSAVITGHTRSPSYYFLPVGPVGDAGVPPASVAWRLTDSLARSRYAPRHVRRLTTLPYQLARFPRGDSTLLIAAFQVTDPSMSRDIRQGIGVLRGSGLTVTAAPSPGRIAFATPADTVIISIEAHDTTSRHAQRARFPLTPLRCAPEWCLSDLLFVAPPANDSAPDPEVALTSALPAPRITAGEPLGIYWETQTPAKPTPIAVSLTISPVRVSVARRIASRLRLARPVTPVRLHWQTLSRRARQAHQVTARLPDGLSGRFLVRVVIDRPGRESLAAEREVVVER